MFPLFALLPFPSTRSTISKILQALPELHNLSDSGLFVLYSGDEVVLEWLELFQFGSKQSRFDGLVMPVKQEEVRDVIGLNLRII